MADVTTERLDRDKASMRCDTYPGARWIPPKYDPSSGYWTVSLRVKPEQGELHRVVNDLEHERTVDMSTNGQILESDTCTADHEVPVDIDAIRHHLDSIPDIWTVMIMYPSSVADPKTWLKPSWWSAKTLTRHGHLNSDGSACVFYAPSNAWNPSENTLAQYVDQLAIWILKTEIWVARGAHSQHRGWPGPGQSHDLSVLLKAPVSSRCQCGSGANYRDCCRPRHLHEMLFGRSSSVFLRDEDDFFSPVSSARSSLTSGLCKFKFYIQRKVQ